MTQQGAAYLVPGQTDGLRVLPAVMIDGAGNVIASVDQGNATAAILATEIGGPVQNLYNEAPVQRVADGNTGGLTQNPQVAGCLALFLGVNVTGGTAGTTLTAYIDQMDANGVWQTIATAPEVSGLGASNMSVGVGGQSAAMLNGGPYRIGWHLGGTATTPSATFQLSLQGR
jgi:hypothetical protein